MELVNEIVEARNFWEAWMSVRRNKGAAGIDKMSVDILDVYMPQHMDEIKQSICRKQYKPSPVRRVFIPKPNGKQRPLGIPTVVDRVVQQATAQVLTASMNHCLVSIVMVSDRIAVAIRQSTKHWTT